MLEAIGIFGEIVYYLFSEGHHTRIGLEMMIGIKILIMLIVLISGIALTLQEKKKCLRFVKSNFNIQS